MMCAQPRTGRARLSGQVASASTGVLARRCKTGMISTVCVLGLGLRLCLHDFNLVRGRTPVS
jgi:hypothetical protein